MEFMYNLLLKADRRLLIPFKNIKHNIHTRSRLKLKQRSDNKNENSYSLKFLNYNNLKRFMYGLGFLYTGYSVNKQLKDPNSMLYMMSNPKIIEKVKNKQTYILKVDKFEDNLNEYHNVFSNAFKGSKLPIVKTINNKEAFLIDAKKNGIVIPEGKDDDFLSDMHKLYTSYQESAVAAKDFLLLRNKTEMNLLYKKELKHDIKQNEINELEDLKTKYKELNEMKLSNQFKIVKYLLQYTPKTKLESEYNKTQSRIVQLTNAILNIQEPSILGTTLLYPASNKLVYLLKFDGDMNASSVELLREEITAILSESSYGQSITNRTTTSTTSNSNRDINVVLRLNSGGGTVVGYGLGAAQLVRLKEAGISLTICVDEIAASGGYLMAAVADKIICSPFAMIGSIGVITTIPNISERLSREGISVEEVTAGKYKRTLTPFKKVTSIDRSKVQEDIQIILNLFINFLNKYRPHMNMNELATGEVWIGSEALEKGLVDEIGTVDEYLLKLLREGADIYNVRIIKNKPSIASLFTSSMNGNVNLDNTNDITISQLLFHMIKELFLNKVVTNSSSKSFIDLDDFESNPYRHILLKHDTHNKYLKIYNK